MPVDEKTPVSEERQPEEVQTPETQPAPKAGQPEEKAPEETTEPSKEFFQTRFQETNEELKDARAETKKHLDTIAELEKKIQDPTLNDEEYTDVNTPEGRKSLVNDIANQVKVNNDRTYLENQKLMVSQNEANQAYGHISNWADANKIDKSEMDKAIKAVNEDLPAGTSPATIAKYAMKHLQLEAKAKVKEVIQTTIAEDTKKKTDDLANVAEPEPGAATSPEPKAPLTVEQNLDQKFKAKAKNANDAIFGG